MAVPFSEVSSGFIVSNFDKSKAYVFKEEEISFSRLPGERPNCYSKEDYLTKAEKFIDEIQQNNLSKAIFSRIKSYTSEKREDEVFDALQKAYPSAFVYLISSEHFGTWIGATPETLITCDEQYGRTVSLAGTKRSNDTSPWGEKEKFEQQFVTDFIEDQLKSLSLASIKKDGPKDRIAGPVKHLETAFQFSIKGVDPITIADKLHPTPAVSGLPQKEAVDLINSLEDHDRSLYAGCIGIVGQQTQLFVNLRCAQFINKEYFLYLGGGFTKHSQAVKEWEETENKSRTMLDILENS
ncbi:MAG: chorismate-binding protein [Crocinitomicaceae bacterium]|nr:chorismate-binding protein [Crocinitomicaceae bacterium]